MNTKEKLEKVREINLDKKFPSDNNIYEPRIDAYRDIYRQGANLFLESLAEAIDCIEKVKGQVGKCPVVFGDEFTEDNMFNIIDDIEIETLALNCIKERHRI